MFKKELISLLLVAMIFGCSSSDKKGTKSTGSAITQVEASTVTDAEKLNQRGQILYTQFCQSCHNENGEGVAHLYPPLAGSEWVAGDTEWLIRNVLEGQEGPITVKGVEYNAIMAKLDYLTDEEIATVLTFVRSNFGNNSGAITEAEVAAVRKKIQVP